MAFFKPARLRIFSRPAVTEGLQNLISKNIAQRLQTLIFSYCVSGAGKTKGLRLRLSGKKPNNFGQDRYKGSCFYKRRKLSGGNAIGIAFFTVFLTTTISCTLGAPGGAYQQLLSQPLSLTDSNFKTCVFDPSYSIVHFPMYHFPAGGHYTQADYERTARSQFQLFHTLLNYNRAYWDVSLFEESVTTDAYNEAFLRSLRSGLNPSEQFLRVDGRRFYMEERLRTAELLFRAGAPRYYEHLSDQQKDFLFNMGAGFTLYFLREIPRLHKVISSEDWDRLKANLLGANNRLREGIDNYWIFDFREQALRKEVTDFYRKHYRPGKLLFISYGAAHNFSNWFAGYPFQSGHDICLGWTQR